MSLAHDKTILNAIENALRIMGMVQVGVRISQIELRIVIEECRNARNLQQVIVDKSERDEYYRERLKQEHAPIHPDWEALA